jgi:hypothetical protein
MVQRAAQFSHGAVARVLLRHVLRRVRLLRKRSQVPDGRRCCARRERPRHLF